MPIDKGRKMEKRWTPEKVRQRIQISAIVKHLHDHVFGLNKMGNSQVRAAEILLNKVIPNLAAVEHTGEVGMKHYIVQAEPLDDAAWQITYGNADSVGTPEGATKSLSRLPAN